MNESDQSIAAASRPHHPEGDEPFPPQPVVRTDPPPPERETRAPGLWQRLKDFLVPGQPSFREDLRSALQDEENGDPSLSGSERTMLANVLKLSATRVDDVMVPRVDIEAVEEEETLGRLVQILRDSGHSRLPVYADSLDNIVGMIHIKDALQHLSEPVEKPNGSPIKMLNPALKTPVKSLDCIRKVLFVPPSMPVADLLQSMQATHQHMAIVVDEYGGTDGLVTLEDLLEAVVGDIEDEHDDAESALVTREAPNVFCADARASLEELREVIGTDFDPGELEEEVDTLGGLLFALVDRIPVQAEVITDMKGFEFEILQADPRRVRKVRITRRPRKLAAHARSASRKQETSAAE